MGVKRDGIDMWGLGLKSSTHYLQAKWDLFLDKGCAVITKVIDERVIPIQ